MCLAAAHALVKLDDGTVVGDPMEKTTLDALEWNLAKGDVLTPGNDSAYKVTLTIRRRFQFSSALKRMSTISSLPGGKLVAAVKGAPETIRTMLAVVPKDYDETYKWYTRQGSRVLALGMKEMDALKKELAALKRTGSEAATPEAAAQLKAEPSSSPNTENET